MLSGRHSCMIVEIDLIVTAFVSAEYNSYDFLVVIASVEFSECLVSS